MTRAGIVALLLLSMAALTRASEPAAPATAFHAILDEQWEAWMRENPTWASTLGDRRWNDRWGDRSLAALALAHAGDVARLERVRAIDRITLGRADRLDHELFERRLADEVEEYRFRRHLLALNQRGGLQTQNELAEQLRFETVKDYDDWLARLRTLPEQAVQVEALLREGMTTGMVHPRVIMERVPPQIENQIVEDPEKSPFWKPFGQLLPGLPAETRERLQREARSAIREQVVPAYRRFLAFFRDHYLPATRATVGAWALPDGAAFYAFAARHYTTTALSPEQIHELGLKEVARIRAAMQEVMRECGFRGSFEEFLSFLRSDPRFYYKTGEELLAGYLAIAKRADPELVRLFGRLPRMPYGVKAIPDETAPDTTTAYYSGPSPDGSRAGTYWVNLYRPEDRPRYEMEALTLHEAVPGHHLQIALAQELGELPRFRRHTGYTAFVEGWALYAESLGHEMGFYQDPYSHFGQLSYEMWRAVRLVVDTGLHAMKWERQRAIDYFKANAPKSELDIVNEVDRYIAWPGQALAYKIGELKIQELRRRAVEALGDRFDLRAFHDRVLGSGAVPLDVLERDVDAWIGERKALPREPKRIGG